MAALGVLRAWAGAGRAAAADARAGRLGRRGGRALRPQPVRQLGVRGDPRPGRGREACATPTAARSRTCWPRTASSSSGRSRRRAAAERLGAYLELHIEQGPVLEAEGLRAAAVSGCVGVERHRFRFTRPGLARRARRRWTRRRDAGLAAAEAALRIERDRAERHGGVATTGRARAASPGSPRAVAGRGRAAASTCATPRPASWRRCSPRPAPRPQAAAAAARLRGSARSRSGGSSRSRSTRTWSRRRAGLRGGCGLRPRADQRRPSRRRRGRARAARRDGLLPVDRGHQPRHGRRTPRRADLAVGDRGVRRCSRTGCSPIPHLPLRGCL